MSVVIVVVIAIFWVLSAALFSYSSCMAVSVMRRLKKRVSAVCDYQEPSNVRLMPWNIAITHCAGLPCAMLSYIIFHTTYDCGFIENRVHNILHTLLMPSAVIIIGLIVVNLVVTVLCAFKCCEV